MDEVGEFLLQLYRAARELGPEPFQALVLERLQTGVAFAAAFRGSGRFVDGIVPTALHTGGAAVASTAAVPAT